MGNEVICRKCRSGRIVNGKCTHCGSVLPRSKPTNALPSGYLLNNGRFRIERVLGEGGYGITYAAMDLQEQRRVAVKEFFPSYAFRRDPGRPDVIYIDTKDEEALARTRIRFNEEAALLMNLKNTREIVEVYHSFQGNQTAYYTMELLQGKDMQKRLQMHGRMFWHELSPIVIQILRALYMTHRAGYIHRDVTPDNIFLLDDGTARLIDFGNARRYIANGQLTAVVKDKFAPREQYNVKGKQGPWTDIYSLSVTIYYAMTGTLPPKATERNPAENQLPLLHKVADVPPEVGTAVQIGMSADENRRYQNVTDFAYAMFPGQSIFGELTRRPAPQPVPDRAARARGAARFKRDPGATGPVVQQPFRQPNPMPGRQTGSRNAGMPVLVCLQGVKKGFRMNLPVGLPQTLGRGPGKAIRYPDQTSGVSRNQCSFQLQANGVVYLKDDGSSYGTAVNGYLIPSGKWMPLKRGDYVSFGKEVYFLQ